MRAISRAAERFFFAPVDTFALGLFRILFCGTIFYFNLSRVPAYEGFVRARNFSTHAFAYYHLSVFNHEVWFWLARICTVTMLLAALGLLTRLNLILAALSYLLFLLPVDLQFQPYEDNLTFFVLAILAFAPGVQRFSLDALISGRTPKTAPAWPREAILISLGLVYFAAAVSKLVNGGWGWMEGETLQAILFSRYLYGFDPLIGFIVERHWLCRLLSVGTMLAESSFVFLVLDRKRRKYTGLVGLGMHFGIFLTMRINFFRMFCPVYYAFIDRDLLKRFLPQKPALTPERA